MNLTVPNSRMLACTFFFFPHYSPSSDFMLSWYLSSGHTYYSISGQGCYNKLHKEIVVIPVQKRNEKPCINFKMFLQFNLLMSPYCLPQPLPYPKLHIDPGSCSLFLLRFFKGIFVFFIAVAILVVWVVVPEVHDYLFLLWFLLIRLELWSHKPILS